MKPEKCYYCGKNPVAYIAESYIKNRPALKICCACADQLIQNGMREALNIRLIKDDP